MPLSKRPPQTRRCVCGQQITNSRAADGWWRCVWCVEQFGKSNPKRARASGQLSLVDKPAEPTEAVKRERTAVTLTDDNVRKLRAAREAADRDGRGALFLKLRRQGLSIADALERAEGSHGTTE